ncbi:MAG TPA: hypothetical protein VHO50_10255 [Bacteroidales bacterium]|nr:hypothetical protein [Bacteroidales bacterium]
MPRSKIYFLDYDPRITDLNILHTEGCLFLPASTNCIGSFDTKESALDEARVKYKGAILCPLCCRKVSDET